MTKKVDNLPKTIHVVISQKGTKDECFLADTNLQSLVSSADESPAVVGTYQLVNQTKWEESVQEVR
jgi:hypothetical protein